MVKRLLPVTLLTYLIIIVFSWGCNKLDTTNLGSDLIPAIDNVNTFADTLDIVTTQGVFNDTFKIRKSESNVLGYISNDPLIGTTKADMFFQIKPPRFPFYWGDSKDTITGLDSMVLTLAVSGFWGDSTVPQSLQVYPILDQGFADSPYKARTIEYLPQNFGPMIGSTELDVRRLKDTIRPRNDSVINQIRIKIDQTFAEQFFNRDSVKANSLTNAFYSDSVFRKFYNGFAVRAVNGNGLMYINLSDAKTRLEVYYRREKFGNGATDTTRTNLTVNFNDFGSVLPSATSNYVQRAFTSNVTNPAPEHRYLVTGPGTYVNLDIPGLATFENRIIHRAEIYIEQSPDNPIYDSIFSPPSYLYLDLKDTGNTKWKPIYFDLNPQTPYDPDYKIANLPYYPGGSGVDFTYFGGFRRTRYNYLNQKVAYYTINIARYVQQTVTKGTPNYQLRLFPAYNLFYPQYINASIIPYYNPLAMGRIRINSGEHPDDLKKMRLVIISSKR